MSMSRTLQFQSDFHHLHAYLAGYGWATTKIWKKLVEETWNKKKVLLKDLTMLRKKPAHFSKIVISIHTLKVMGGIAITFWQWWKLLMFWWAVREKLLSNSAHPPASMCMLLSVVCSSVWINTCRCASWTGNSFLKYFHMLHIDKRF